MFLKGSTSDRPVYYGPQDFLIGSVISVFRHKFLITGADLYVLNFAEQHPDQFPTDVISNLRQYLGGVTGRLNAKERNNVTLVRRQGDFDRIYSEIRNKLKSSRVTNSEDARTLFLKYDSDRTGYISKENIKDLFRKVSLPLDDDIIETVKKTF